jgi:hypothetical protein
MPEDEYRTIVRSLSCLALIMEEDGVIGSNVN